MDTRKAEYSITKADAKGPMMRDFGLTSKEYDDLWPAIRKVLESWMRIPGEGWEFIYDDINRLVEDL